MMRQPWRVCVGIACLLLPVFPVFAGTILNAYPYAWSDQLGYIRFDNVVVTDSALSGYAWSANAGWIKFDPVQGGVLNDGAGNLSGSAWGSNLGWIDFDGVTIDGSTGQISGVATGSQVGTITFDCGYCDVRTDWRQGSAPPAPPTSGGSGGGGIVVSSPIVVNNPPVSLPSQPSTTSVQGTLPDEVVDEASVNQIASQNITVTIVTEPVGEVSIYPGIEDTELVGSSLYTVSATDENGNDVRFFSMPVTMTLSLPAGIPREARVAVYWLNETNLQWVLIPDAVFAQDTVTFTMSHVAKLAVFSTQHGVGGSSVIAWSGLPVSLDQASSPTSTTIIPTTAISNEDAVTQNTTTIDQISSSLPLIKTYGWQLGASVAIIISTVFSLLWWKRRV